jgi:hypothetical protein
MAIVDTIRTTYKELFTVTLVHPSYETQFTYEDPVSNTSKTITGSDMFNALSVEPDADTRKLFMRYSMNYACSDNMIVCFIRADTGKPFIKFPSDMRIRFLVKFKIDFLHRTQVVATGSQQVYVFSNTNNTLDNGIKHITKNAAGVTDSDIENNSLVTPAENCSGVIDILASVTNSDFSLLNGDALSSPAFVIRFLKK